MFKFKIISYKMLKLVGEQILTTPKINRSKIIFFDWCGDVHPLPLKVIFEDAETVVFLRCNKNFMYYWLKPSLFPKLKTVYTDMLCEDEIYRFNNLEVYCSNDHIYNKFKRRHDIKNRRDTKIMPIDFKQIETLIKISSNIE